MLKEKIRLFLNEHFLALSLVFIGLIVRLLFIHHQGLSNDELSGIMRCHFPTISDLLREGVKNGDMHPALYQILMWCWINLFGETELAVRSLSLLFFVLNMLLIYLMAVQFFSKNTGIFILVIYSSFTFLIMHTVFSRPYNSGIFFLLLLVYSVLKFAKSQLKFSSWGLGILLGFVGSMYSHYFAFLVAAIIGFCSLFYLGRNKRIVFLIIGVISCLLFIPHLNITFHQLNQGGLGWLGKPTSFWLLDFFIYFTNNSSVLFYFLVLILVLGLRKKSSSTKEEKFFLAIFVLSYISGHVLSVLYTPVLRDLVMLFLLPFLFFFLFGFMKSMSVRKLYLSISILFPMLFFHSVYAGNLFRPLNFGVFREIGQLGNQFEKKYGKENITYLSSFCSMDYINYYRDNKVDESIKKWEQNDLTKTLYQRVKKSKTPYFIYQRSNHSHSVFWYEMIREEYPYVVFHKSFFNSNFTLYSRYKRNNRYLKKREIHFKKSFSDLHVKSNLEFFANQKMSVSSLEQQANQEAGHFLIEANGVLAANAPFYFVVVLERDGKILESNSKAEMYISENQTNTSELNKEGKFIVAFELPEKAQKDDVIHFYCWNPNKVNIEFFRPNWYFVTY